MHHVPATARAPRVCTLVPFINHAMPYTQEGQTPLLLAVRKRNIAMAKELLGAGADPNHIEEVSDRLNSHSP